VNVRVLFYCNKTMRHYRLAFSAYDWTHGKAAQLASDATMSIESVKWE
jgi:hypothetical protein